jgi:hypothetical protein
MINKTRLAHRTLDKITRITPNICGWLRSGTGVASRTYQLDLVPGGDQPDCSGNGGGTSQLYGGHG